MRIAVVIDLNVGKEEIEEICKVEEIVGGWKSFIQRELEISGLDSLEFDYDIHARILSIKEVDKHEKEV